MQTQPLMSDVPSVLVDPVLLQSPFGPQAVLYVEVCREFVRILASGDGDWLRVLLGLDWRALRQIAAQYYQALWELSAEAARRRAEAGYLDELAEETLEEATLRLLEERPTGGNEGAPILHPTPRPPSSTPTVRPDLLEPGVVPIRSAGKAPKCFFALLKAFVGVQAMGQDANAEAVFHHLQISAEFAKACGFTQPCPSGKYRQSDVPSIRKLQQFEGIMSARGLWAEVSRHVVRENLAQGTVKIDGQTLAQDTTHYVAFSAMRVVEVPEAAKAPQSPPPTEVQPAPEGQNVAPTQATKPVRRSRQARRGQRRAARAERKARLRDRFEERRAQRAARSGRKAPAKRVPKPQALKCAAPTQTAIEKEKKPKRKSQSRTIKNCRCADRETCPHGWELSDPGAGTVVKGSQVGGKRKYWAHKAAVLSTAPGGIPLHVVAMSDAASHDGEALEPQLKAFLSEYPELEGKVRTVLADAAMDDADTKQRVRQEFGIDVKTPINPRGIKTITTGLGRGMKSLTPTGTFTCQADREMSFRGVRYEQEKFLYGPPLLSSGEVACLTCPLRDSCCRTDTAGGRHVEIPTSYLPHIDPADPPMARSFKMIMRQRTSVERAIKKLKLDFGDPRLTRRGNDAFQAHLDRSMIALHLLLRLGS